jgi:hypothetical protein
MTVIGEQDNRHPGLTQVRASRFALRVVSGEWAVSATTVVDSAECGSCASQSRTVRVLLTPTAVIGAITTRACAVSIAVRATWPGRASQSTTVIAK